VPVVVACGNEAMKSSRAEELRARGVQLLQVASIEEILADAHARRITHLLVEPGPALAGIFFEGGWVDRLWVFQSPQSIDDPIAPAAAEIPGDYRTTGSLEFKGDRLTEFLNPNSAVFFEAATSADLKWASSPPSSNRGLG